MALPRYLTARVAACLSVLIAAPGCNSSDARARDALNAYQAAEASNDLTGAHDALLKLVRAKDDVSDYWVELGKLDASMGNYSDAYYAFTRAYELDRTNVDVLRVVIELALRTGDISLAQSHAEELEVLSPGDSWVALTKGWSAYSESHFDEAIAVADKILANSPYDPGGTVLKARSLLRLGREQDAVDLLTKQSQSQPSDIASQQVLESIYLLRQDWANTAEVAKRIDQLSPSDNANAMVLVEAALRSGNIGIAREVSLRVLRRTGDPARTSSVLDLWVQYWPSPQRIQDARALAAAAPLSQKLVYAAFLTRVGSPADAVRLSSGAAGLPVKAKNAEANAVLADAWAKLGNLGEAKQRFDAVLAYDPGNATALRGRAELELRTGNAGAAIVDAEKLVAVLPNSAPERLLLARSYAAAGNSAAMQRTLWSAFQAIPADERIYAALLATKKGDSEATNDLQGEFDRQRAEKLNRGLL